MSGYTSSIKTQQSLQSAAPPARGAEINTRLSGEALQYVTRAAARKQLAGRGRQGERAGTRMRLRSKTNQLIHVPYECVECSCHKATGKDHHAWSYFVVRCVLDIPCMAFNFKTLCNKKVKAEQRKTERIWAFPKHFLSCVYIKPATANQKLLL